MKDVVYDTERKTSPYSFYQSANTYRYLVTLFDPVKLTFC